MASPPPPPNFITLDKAVSASQKVNVIGVCVDYLEPTKSLGPDCVCTFTLHDPSWPRGIGLKFRFFNRTIDELPKIQRNGDVIILRNVTMIDLNSSRIGTSNSTTSWVVLSGSSILESKDTKRLDIAFVTSREGHTRAPAPTPEECQYAKRIARLEDPSNYRAPVGSTALQVENTIKEAGGTPPRRKEKWQPIKDLIPQQKIGKYNFADLFGEVRKTWYDNGGRVELSLTDYTTNTLLYNYSSGSKSQEGDQFGYSGGTHDQWPGPWGRMTINVTLFDSHANYARSQIKPGMYVWIRNCQIKLDKNNSKLEAVCRGDHNDPYKVNVSISKPYQAKDDPKFMELLQRRLDYENEANAKGLRFDFGKAAQNGVMRRELEKLETVKQSKENSAASLKRMRKAERKRAKKENTESTETKNPGSITNQHVRCQNINIPIAPISSILDTTTLRRKTPQGNEYTLPFQNCSYKVKVRVVDYWPHDLADFSVPYRLSDYSALSDIEDGDDITMTDLPSTLASVQDNPHSVRWEWRFFLVVEDANPAPGTNPNDPRPQMALLVADGDGDGLVNAEASDLRGRPRDIANLKEKLFVLWGDLQEKKEEAAAASPAKREHAPAPVIKAQSKPFECFVKEYGIPLPGQHTNRSTGGGGQDMDMDIPNPIEYQRMFRLFGITT